MHARLDFEASPPSLERTTRTISGWCSGDKYKFQLRSNTLIIPVRIGSVAIARETSRLWNPCPSLVARESSTPFAKNGDAAAGETRQIAASSKHVYTFDRSFPCFLIIAFSSFDDIDHIVSRTLNRNFCVIPFGGCCEKKGYSYPKSKVFAN